MKKRIITTMMLSAIVLTSAAPALNVHADTNSDIAKQTATIQNAQSAKAKAEAQMKSLQAKVDSIKKSREAAQNKLEQLEKEADQLNRQVKSLKVVINERQDNLESQARSAQVNGSATNYISTLLDSKSMSDALQKVTAMATVSSANKQMIDAQKRDQDTLEAKLATAQKNYGQYEQIVQGLDDSAKELSSQHAQLILATTNYQLTITTATNKKNALLAQKAKEEAAVKAAEAAQKAQEEQQAKAAEQAAASQKAAEQAQANDNNTSSSSSSVASSSNSSSNTTSSSSSSSSNSSSSSSSSSNASSNSNSGNSASSSVGGYTNYNGSNNYALNNCTWYVWNYYAAQGVYLPASMGNGADWASGPLAHSGKVAGAIVSFAGGTYIDATYQGGGRASWTTSGAYGHVGIVLQVYPDGSYLMGSGSTSGGWQEIIVKASVPGTYLWP